MSKMFKKLLKEIFTLADGDCPRHAFDKAQLARRESHGIN
jgi:hypothetical protein